MSLQTQISVARRFQRSVRIDTDLNNPKALEGFICPKSSGDVILSMARHISETGQAAFTWTGPYGSGKSSLVIALSALLSGNDKVRQKAQEAVGKSVANSVWNSLPPKSKGWHIVPVVGRRAAAAEVIGEALSASGLITTTRNKDWDESRVVSTLERIVDESQKHHGGLILFLDEMGKFLEGAAHDGHDVYIFQRLAEAASRSNGKLVVVGILHQAFDEYAQKLARELRDEWAKVQGRFIDLVINTTGDEQLELLSRAIENKTPAKQPSDITKHIAKLIRESRPSASANLSLLLHGCWPLHPIVSLLLGPISRRRFGQNQRSLFGFLSSAEPFGFQDFLKEASKDDLYTPARLWDYLKSNLESAILASPDGHRWSVAVEAVERCQQSAMPQIATETLKALCLIDLFKERSGLSANPEILATCSTSLSAAKAQKLLEELREKSYIIFRKHLSSYGVYAGSDFDIERAIAEASDKNRTINLQDLRNLAGLQPILAKRHYHETGALRWFNVDLAPVSQVSEFLETPYNMNGAIGRIVLCIPTLGEAKLKAQTHCSSAAEQMEDNILVGLPMASWHIMETAREFVALNKILEDRPELNGDAVARREVVARLGDTKARLEADLQKMIDSAFWYRRDCKPEVYNAPGLNSLLSDIADKRYAQAPRIYNELLNRQKPSSNAVSAQKALLKLMVDSEGEPRLGISGYPAEGGIFDSIILPAGLYRLTPQGWRFSAPDKSKDTTNLLPAWKVGEALLEKNQNRAVSMAELYEVWSAPPFGIKEGLLPLIGVAFLLSMRNKVAFYREGIFQARFTDLDIDYLSAEPKDIQLRWMNLDDTSRKILSELAKLVRELDDHNRLVHLEPLDVARALVGIHDNLKLWVKRTNKLSANAIRIRGIFKQASDPNKFLFDDIPALVNPVASAKKDIESTLRLVREALVELTQAYPEMLARLRVMMLSELLVPNASSQSLADLRDRALNIQQLTGDFRLNAFIGRLTTYTGSEQDMEGIASLAVNKPARDWTDSDLDQAAIEITELSQKFIRAETFARVKGRDTKRQAMAVMVGIDGRPTPISGEFAISTREQAEVDSLVAKISKSLSDFPPERKNILLAALAQLGAKYISAGDDGHNQKKKKAS